MRTSTNPSTAILATMLALSLQAAPAQAASAKTWVASNGTNNATCGRTTPCDTFAHAQAATSPSGEINCIDADDYGPVTITQSLSIVCDNTQAGILVISSDAITISAGANDIVTVKGLDIDGGGTGLFGIHFLTGAALHVENVHIRNFRNSGSSAGVSFVPNSYAELYVSDSTISDNGSGNTNTAGIVVRPSGSGGSANVSISRVQMENNNSSGLLLDASASTGAAINATVSNSMVTGNAGNGMAAVSIPGGPSVSILVDHSAVAGNFASGINANGSTASGAGSALVRIGDSTIALNVTGVSTSGAGVVQSFKNNRISGNLTDGTPIAAFPGPGGTPLQ